MAAEFTHLHLHTGYSLLDGACDVDKLAKHLEKIGQKSAAFTDHWNIYGAVHFFDAMKKKGDEGLVWTEENLTSYLKDPKAFVPGNKMIFVGLKKDDEVADVVAVVFNAVLEGAAGPVLLCNVEFENAQIFAAVFIRLPFFLRLDPERPFEQRVEELAVL